MSSRKAVFAILFLPILFALLLFLAVLFVWKLPMFCCERCRAVRYLPYAGLAYYGLAVPLVLTSFGLAWWEVLIGTGLFALTGNWLLPDPLTFALNPRRRRAVRLSIEYLDAGDGPRVIYGMVDVIGSEAGRTIVCASLSSGTNPLARRFLAVADDSGTIDELNFEYVSTRHGVHELL
jgi:hypothetical protein